MKTQSNQEFIWTVLCRIQRFSSHPIPWNEASACPHALGTVSCMGVLAMHGILTGYQPVVPGGGKDPDGI